MSLRLRRIVELRDGLRIHDCRLASKDAGGCGLADLGHIHVVFGGGGHQRHVVHPHAIVELVLIREVHGLGNVKLPSALFRGAHAGETCDSRSCGSLKLVRSLAPHWKFAL